MLDVPLNALTVVLSFLTTHEILKYSSLNHQLINLFQENETLWEIALISKPIGYCRKDEGTGKKGIHILNLKRARPTCIELLKVYDSCKCTSSILLLLSTLSCYTTCHDLCYFIYSRILRIYRSNSLSDYHIMYLQIYQSFVHEFAFYQQNSIRLFYALEAFASLLRFHTISSEAHNDYGVASDSISAIANTVTDGTDSESTNDTWMQQSLQMDRIYGHNDAVMCFLLTKIIDNRRKLQLYSSTNHSRDIQYSSNMNYNVLQMAIRTCINLSISPVQAKIMQQQNISRIILDILKDNETQFQKCSGSSSSDTNNSSGDNSNSEIMVDINENKQFDHVLNDGLLGERMTSIVNLSFLCVYLLMNIIDKRNVDYNILEEIFKAFTEVVKMLFVLLSNDNNTGSAVNNIITTISCSNHLLFVPETLKIIDFLLSLCLWQRVYLRSPVILESVTKLYTIIVQYEQHGVQVDDDTVHDNNSNCFNDNHNINNISTNNIPVELECLKLKAIVLIKTVNAESSVNNTSSASNSVSSSSLTVL